MKAVADPEALSDVSVLELVTTVVNVCAEVWCSTLVNERRVGKEGVRGGRRRRGGGIVGGGWKEVKERGGG